MEKSFRNQKGGFSAKKERKEREERKGRKERKRIKHYYSLIPPLILQEIEIRKD